MSNDHDDGVLPYIAAVAFSLNVITFIFGMICKIKRKNTGSLVNLLLAFCIIHSIIDSYLFEKFKNYEKFIHDVFICSLNLIKFDFNSFKQNLTQFGSPSEDIANEEKKDNCSNYALLTIIIMSILMEIYYCLESIQLLKNPNSTFSIRGKIGVAVMILFFFIFIICNIIFLKIKNGQFAEYLSYYLIVIPLLYILLSIYGFFILRLTYKTKSNFMVQIRTIAFALFLIIIISTLVYLGLFILSILYLINGAKKIYLYKEVILTSTIIIHGVIANITRAVCLLNNPFKKTYKLSNVSNDNYSQITDDDVSSTLNILTKPSVKLLAKALRSDNSNYMETIRSNYLSLCFYYMLKVILHISDNLDKKKNEVKYIKPLNYEQRINHELIFDNDGAIKEIKQSEEKVPNFCKNLVDNFIFYTKRVRITEYSPHVFHNIMLLDKLKYSVLQKSFDVQSNIDNICNFTGSEGKSGSIFFMTHDNKFLLKSIPEREFKALNNDFLKKYYELNSQYNNSTLMRIYGTFQLRIEFNQIYFILMENIAPFPSSSFLFKFDLKGSKKGRKNKEMLKNKKKVHKDLDYLELIKINEKAKINLDSFQIDLLKPILENDLEILYKSNLMDYSLFICVMENDNLKEKNNRMFVSKDKKYVYCIGIIDFLTEYRNMKSLEHTYLSIYNDPESISAIHPLKYSKRFSTFIFTEVLKNYD